MNRRHPERNGYLAQCLQEEGGVVDVVVCQHKVNGFGCHRYFFLSLLSFFPSNRLLKNPFFSSLLTVPMLTVFSIFGCIAWMNALRRVSPSTARTLIFGLSRFPSNSISVANWSFGWFLNSQALTPTIASQTTCN